MSVFVYGSQGTWLEYASLAANEGLKDEAVDALGGYPAYDELLRERERRVARIRSELERLEAVDGRGS